MKVYIIRAYLNILKRLVLIVIAIATGTMIFFLNIDIKRGQICMYPIINGTFPTFIYTKVVILYEIMNDIIESYLESLVYVFDICLFSMTANTVYFK